MHSLYHVLTDQKLFVGLMMAEGILATIQIAREPATIVLVVYRCMSSPQVIVTMRPVRRIS